MTDLIKIIYEEAFYSSRVRTPEGQELRTAEEEFMEKLLPLLGRKTLDDIYNLYNDIEFQSNLDWFREGFHLGAMLMMELFPTQHRVQ